MLDCDVGWTFHCNARQGSAAQVHTNIALALEGCGEKEKAVPPSHVVIFPSRNGPLPWASLLIGAPLSLVKNHTVFSSMPSSSTPLDITPTAFVARRHQKDVQLSTQQQVASTFLLSVTFQSNYFVNVCDVGNATIVMSHSNES